MFLSWCCRVGKNRTLKCDVFFVIHVKMHYILSGCIFECSSILRYTAENGECSQFRFSIPRLCALNLTQPTSFTLFYLTFSKLTDICSYLYKVIIEIHCRHEPCKARGELLPGLYCGTHKQQPLKYTDAQVCTCVSDITLMCIYALRESFTTAQQHLSDITW